MTAGGRTSRSDLDPARLVERLTALVRSESENPPGNEKAVAEITAAFCSDLGLDVSLHEVEPGRPSVVARWRGGEGPTVGYCSHIDVVPAGAVDLWSHEPYGAEIVDRRMYGRGSSDAKGPCAAALEAVAMMKSAGVTFDGTLELSFVADEESGGYKGAAALVEAGTLHPDVAIVGEPTRLNIVRAQRGIAWLRIVTRGLAGHGSAPERGINAIRHMAAVIDALEPTLPDIHHDLLGGPTISVGTISGGEKLNIIPARCEIEVDRRLLPGETEASMLATIEEAFDRARARFPNLDASVEVVHLGFPFECDPEALVVREAVAAIGEVSGTAPEIVGFRGASDARFFAETGADVVVFGPGDITVAHTADEFIDLDELERGALAYSLLFGRLLGAR